MKEPECLLSKEVFSSGREAGIVRVMKSVLIVEDDPNLGRSLRQGLEENGYEVDLAADGSAARVVLSESNPDIIILDLGLPDCDGLDLLESVRANGHGPVVLILTARDGVADKVGGLESGADDYLTKPFAFSELLARTRALLRRSHENGTTIAAGDIVIDLVAREVTRSGRVVVLTPREFDLLAYLVRNAGRIVSRDMLARDVWRETSRFTPLDNVIDVHVSRLRKKLGDDACGCGVRVVRGVGISLALDKSGHGGR